MFEICIINNVMLCYLERLSNGTRIDIKNILLVILLLMKSEKNKSFPL